MSRAEYIAIFLFLCLSTVIYHKLSYFTVFQMDYHSKLIQPGVVADVADVAEWSASRCCTFPKTSRISTRTIFGQNWCVGKPNDFRPPYLDMPSWGGKNKKVRDVTRCKPAHRENKKILFKNHTKIYLWSRKKVHLRNRYFMMAQKIPVRFLFMFYNVGKHVNLSRSCTARSIKCLDWTWQQLYLLCFQMFVKCFWYPFWLKIHWL